MIGVLLAILFWLILVLPNQRHELEALRATVYQKTILPNDSNVIWVVQSCRKK